jgi:hypothetical protein
MAEGASRHWLESHRFAAGDGDDRDGGTDGDTAPAEELDRAAEASRLAAQLADFAWAGLRQVHRI